MSLEALSRGLRAAGGILSPDVQKIIAGEDQEAREAARQEKMVQLRHTLEQEAQKVSPQYQMQMEQLNNERAFRQAVSGAKGDIAQIAGAAAQFGKPELAVQIYNQQEARQARLQQASEAAETRKLQLQQQHEINLQRTTDARERAAEIARHNAAMEQIARQNQALQRELALGNQELRRIQLHQQGQGQLDRRVTAFANELQQNKIPALTASITTANEILKKYEDTDIPGLGLFTGSKRVPDALRSEEAKSVRSALQAVSNDLLNLYSGLAVTLPEAERRELEEMKNGSFGDQDFKNAWPRIVNRYNTVVGNLGAGAGQDVLKEYQSRPGAIKIAPLDAAFNKKKSGGLPKISGDADYDKLPSGAEFIGPDGQKRRKP